jgi:TonB family protein
MDISCIVASTGEMNQRQNSWSDWLLPCVASLALHASFAAPLIALHFNWGNRPDVIDAKLLDIADSNSAKGPANRPADKDAIREISNKEMVQRLNLPMGFPRDLRCSVWVLVARDGKVLEATVSQTSGNANFDHAIIDAIFKSSPFPRPPAEELEDGVYRFQLKFGGDD